MQDHGHVAATLLPARDFCTWTYLRKAEPAGEIPDLQELGAKFGNKRPQEGQQVGVPDGHLEPEGTSQVLTLDTFLDGAIARQPLGPIAQDPNLAQALDKTFRAPQGIPQLFIAMLGVAEENKDIGHITLVN
ncbi:hypothetical protein [Anatilimnocola floriformis]|uniref:hypothetical protein n=1 Tax=Anatilimnocola floriformis TaxID=2948575 RepID=UPI0020C3DF2F|nr:hypothetical protein [Anatilimnocola floriformis]